MTIIIITLQEAGGRKSKDSYKFCKFFKFQENKIPIEIDFLKKTPFTDNKPRRPRNIPKKFTTHRRYHQVSAQCLCEVNSLTGARKKGSCFAAYKGNISIQFDDSLARFHPSRCICQLDWVSKTLWPCFPRKHLSFLTHFHLHLCKYGTPV